MATDFLDALVDAWAADAALAAAGIGLLHYGVDPEGGYPYAVVKSLGEKADGRNTGKGFWDVEHYRFTVFATDRDQAKTLGKAATAALDPILDNPLTFDDGYQMAFYRTGVDLVKVRKAGIMGNPLVWMASYTYMAKIGRTRP
jgi:hypothetical protein